ncbi:MetQ/NlpA family ABC transporter substrate-binding protein [Halanaerobium sp. MA284_MarDTE_T2]|uniref:MetQ/NlpA family ABC transporter substrate-binding protein n=1 Tax=Halanaerobium sp. MA284_MarDTE_T2 TaxID=2183913 RepID=UPI000DF21A65|nr:MetQ/NlpA family ABC transporter substrate-binding protein [Halanaerobium sp. MA284_MarDTE_T2]RCW49926.1 D-methionine transport system substrate-binding protein [Halanaerobium sp. MA284_MarDTE_T2]
MKKKLIVLIGVLSILLAGTVGVFAADSVLKVGATPVPHAEILNQVKDDLAEAGIKLEIVEFTDYVTPNIALSDGSIDANFFQHVPYLNNFSKDRGLELSALDPIHVEPMGLYSDKYTDVEELPEGAAIAVSNDPSNEGRALLLLQENGLIKLENPEDLNATPFDIIENPKNLKFEELEAAQLPRILPDVAAAVINTNYALEAGLNPMEDALLIEGSNSPYANVVAVRSGDEDREDIKKLMEVLQTQEVKDFILKEYEGSVVPVF